MNFKVLLAGVVGLAIGLGWGQVNEALRGVVPGATRSSLADDAPPSEFRGGDPLTSPLPTGRAGLVALVQELRGRLRAAQEARPAEPPSGQGLPNAPVARELAARDREIVGLRDEVAELRAALKAKTDPAISPVDLTDVQVEEHIARQSRALDQAFEKRDGSAAVAVVRALHQLGPRGYQAAMAAIMRLNADLEGPGSLRLSAQTFYTGVADTELYGWALRHPDEAQVSGFRGFAAWGLPWMMPQDDLTRLYAQLLPEERDPQVRQALSSQLGGTPTAVAAQALSQAYKAAAGDAAVQIDLLRLLLGNPTAEAEALLRDASLSDPDPAVRAEAARLLQARLAGISGLYLTQVFDESQAKLAGMLVGDVLLTYAGSPVTSLQQLAELKAKVQGDQAVTVEVYRAGQTLKLTLQPGTIGINGRMVGGR